MDLLFKNFPYFIGVYFSASPLIVIFVFVVCMGLLNATMNKRVSFGSSILCACYITSVLVVTLLNKNRVGGYGAIIDPFYGLYQVIVNGNIHFLRGTISNIVLFIPFGVILQSYFGVKSNWVASFVLLSSSLLIELLQYGFCIGYFETEDIICNYIGGMLGILFIRILKKGKE